MTAKRTTTRKTKKSPDKSLSFDTLSRLGAQFGIPILAGISESSVKDIPVNTVFASVTDQHWLLCIKGSEHLIVFDSLGLPIDTLTRICKGVTIEPWNKFGYQSMFGSVCGYYVVAVLICIQHGATLHNADIDTFLHDICPFHASRPPTISKWYVYHRHHDKQLRLNDNAVSKFVLSIYPNLGWIDRHSSHLSANEVNSGAIGSPLYARAGIHAPSVHQRFGQLNSILTNDTQKAWAPGLTSSLSAIPLRLENERTIAFETEAEKQAERESVRKKTPRGSRYLHLTGPAPNRKPTNAEKVLWARTALSAYDSPAGKSAAGNDDQIEPNQAPQNLVAGPSAEPAHNRLYPEIPRTRY